ncbi:cora-like Mg2+ transporter protein-domain-containing protein [Xylaria arbuscula]|nr:cora-like Mg2+ transporter protein-domain-containing protein [Xylaria arbuscula]
MGENLLSWMKFSGISRVKTNDTELCSLRNTLREWVKAEADMRLRMHEEGPSEEIFISLKKLWTVALVFSSNFFLDSKGHIYALGPRKARILSWSWWRRPRPKAKQEEKSKDTGALDVLITYQPRKPGETLQDLERDLSRILANLRRQAQSETGRLDAADDNNRENRLLLEELGKSGSNHSLFCLLRVSIFSTPSRFSSFNRLVVDFYAQKIFRLEWLIRYQVTRSLVYQLSRLSDELRIARDIIISQRGVVTDIAERFSAAIFAEQAPALEDINPRNSTRRTSENEVAIDRGQGPQTNIEYRKSIRVAKTLQEKARVKHENLLADLEKLEDTTERLKRQAALLLEIRAEGQNTAIFVFTVVTVIFLPLSFVTSYFGMNTSDIRDLDQGQWIFWAIGITLTVAILIIVWLISVKGRGWRTSRLTERLHAFEG